jgi:serine/threonine-protein kinase PknK
VTSFRFRIVEALGKGAMGTVFAADDLWTAERVALKVLWAEDAPIVAGLRAEFGLLAALRDPLLGRVFDFGRLPADLELPGRPPGRGLFYTRELIPGVDLAAAAADDGRRLAGVCRMLAWAGRGLEVLHRAGLRHADFKPRNAIATGGERPVRLIDFGLAIAETVRRAAGTLAYMAPEILAGRAVDRRADLYALGVSLYELATGRLPSGERSGASLIDWHHGGDRPSLREERSDAPSALVDLCARLLARDPDDRLPSAAEAVVALERCADSADRSRRRRSAAAPPVWPPPLVFASVGQSSVSALERAFERRRSGQGGPAMIELTGEAGSGKSTVLTELAWRVQLAGGEVLRGDPRAIGRPLGVVGAVIEKLAAVSGSPVDPSEAGPNQVALAIAAALAEAAERFPLLVLIDDLDFADEGSRALLPAIALALPPRAAVLVVASRTGAAAAEPEATGLVASLAIEPLARREVDEIVSRAAGRRDPRLADWVHRQAGGNLLHLVHTLGELARRGFPVVEKLAGLELPGRLAEWETAQLAAAEPDERAVCEALAAIGTPAVPALVAAVAGLGADRARAALAGAAERGLVATATGQSFRIARPATGHALYHQLDPARRVELHRRAGAALDEAADPVAPLWHLIRAGDGEAVGRRITSALDHLRAAGDHAGALALGAAALDLVDPDPLRLSVGELAQLCGDLARADAALAGLIDRPGELGRRATLALARACDAGGETERAPQLFRAVIAAAPDSEEAAFAARDLAAHHIRHGQASEALAVADQARTTVPRLRGHLDASRAFARGLLGTGDHARTELEAIAAAAGGDQGLVAAARNYAGRLAFAAGDYLGAQAQYQAALAAAEAVGDAGRIAILRMNLGAMAYSFGDFAAALGNYVPALSLLRAVGLATTEVLARRNFGHLLIELGELEQARVELRAAGREAAARGLVVQEIGADALLGVIDWRSGDPDAGRARLSAARVRFADIGDARREAETLLDLAELELEAADADPARLVDAVQHLAAAAAIPATRDDTARRARYLALEADRAARAGETDEARRRLDELAAPLAAIEAQSARQLEWDLHRIASRVAERIGQTGAADRHRARALAILDGIAAALPEAKRIAFWHDPRRRRLRRTSALAGSTVNAAPDLASGDRVIDKLFRLLEIYRRLSTEREVDRLLELAMDTAVELSGCERGFLLLAGADGALRTAIARNLPDAAIADLDGGGGRLPYSRSIAEQVFASGEVIVSSDARVDPRFLGAESVHALHHGRLVCMPIHARGRAAGVLYLEARASARPIAEEDVRLLMAFGDQVAVVLDSARLLRENARRADQLESARGEIEALLAERTELLEQRTEELAIARRDLESVNRRFLGARGAFGIVGRSPAMERVFQLIDRAAAVDVPVIILGESGTGKELVARALHEYGRRRGKPLVSLNCGAVPESLLESELFGHVRGAFTGADRARRGLFAAADGGTLFLDEIGDTPLRMQASLLRALQEGVVRPVGDTRDLSVDVRVIAATHRPLEELVASGRFREDLYYRLHVVAIPLPPLRDRREDIPLLTEHFLAGIAERTGLPARSITRRALRAMREMPWPGNVRQLEHALTQLAILADASVIDLPDVEGLIGSAGSRRAGRPVEDRRAREKRRLVEALEAHGWNRSRAAEALGMPRRTFYRRLAEYDIQ